MSKLSSMPNIAKILEDKLQKVGINSSEELIEIGSKEAFLRIRAEDNSACLNMLCALEGAIQGVRWHGLDDSTKKSLKEFFNKVG
jgi:DNA transformation protein